MYTYRQPSRHQIVIFFQTVAQKHLYWGNLIHVIFTPFGWTSIIQYNTTALLYYPTLITAKLIQKSFAIMRVHQYNIFSELSPMQNFSIQVLAVFRVILLMFLKTRKSSEQYRVLLFVVTICRSLLKPKYCWLKVPTHFRQVCRVVLLAWLGMQYSTSQTTDTSVIGWCFFYNGTALPL